MEWLEVSIYTTNAGIDPICGRLYNIGVTGVEIKDKNEFEDFLENNKQYWDYVDERLREEMNGETCVKIYVSDNEHGHKLLMHVRDELTALKGLDTDNRFGSLRIEMQSLREEDWENNWKQYYEPLEIGEKLLVVPEWIDCSDEGRVPLRLDPGLLFGTGSHATTRMCLTALEKYAGAGKRALDLGCGSGILGIGALVLGSDFCTACDIDPKAPDTVMENAALNGIGTDKMKVYAGDIIGDARLRKMLGTGYDIVLANIVSDVIIPLAPFVRAFMAPGGVFITSGIIDGREDEVAAALRSAGLEIIAHRHEEEWHCFECR